MRKTLQTVAHFLLHLYERNGKITFLCQLFTKGYHAKLEKMNNRLRKRKN